MKLVYVLDIDPVDGSAEESLEIDGQEFAKHWDMVGSHAETDAAPYAELAEGYATESMLTACDFFDSADLVYELLPIEYSNYRIFEC